MNTISQSNNPLVSIIVRTKDRPKLLKNAIQSISTQTYRPLEVVLVNDGGCELDIEELKINLQDISLNYIRLETNMGRPRAGNVGIENAAGKYIGFLDDDDEFYPEHVSVLVGYLEQSDLKVAYTDSLMVYQEYNSQTQELNNIRKELVYSQDFDYEKLIFDNYIPFMCLLFVRDVLLSSGGLDSRFDLFEDYDLLIRIGESYPFYHIRKITAEYNQWCSAFQISQRNKNINFLRESYLKLFSKHIGKFTPERIYNYRSAESIAKNTHIKNLETLIKDKDTHLGNLETLIKDKDTHLGNLETLIKDKDLYIRNLQDIIKGKDQYITSVVFQLKQREPHINSLESTIRDKDAVLNNIYSSHGWKALLVYYRIRDKILPATSIRRRVIKKAFNLLVSLPQYLFKKKTNEGKLIYHIETDLSRPFIVGAGNALYLHGWCYHTTNRIKKLYIFVDGIKYLVSNFSFARYDIFQDHFQKIDNKGNSLHSGFWVIIPFAKIDSKSQVTLAIRAKLYGGEICESSIGTLTLEPTTNKEKCCYNIDGESFEKPVIAICMATYNPSIEYFRKQIDSILHQTYTNWVCIINDDCSKPEIFEKIKDIISGDIRFKIFRNSSNLGFYYNFERCLTYVPKDVLFVALSDQDDSWHEDKLAVLLNHFDDETLLVYSDMNIVNKNGELIHSTYWTTRKNNFTKLDLLIVANTVTGAASIFRRELLEFLLPFPERIGDSYHDNFIACIALSLGNIKYVDYPLYDYRQHSGSVYGHKVPSRDIKKENLISLLKNIKKNKIIGKALKNFRQTLLNYQAVYYNDYIRRILLAHVLKLRCNGLPEKKRKIINRFVSLEKGLYGIIFEVAKNKFLRKGLITIGTDSQLLISVLSTKIINMHNRFKHYFLK